MRLVSADSPDSTLGAELDALRDALKADVSEADTRHLLRIAWIGRGASWLGWASSGFGLNPVSMLLMSLGIVVRWTTVAHHVVHRGYDHAPGIPPRFTSKRFAQGFWARLWHWPDVLHPEAWRHEHNTLHHYRLNEEWDPDQPELNLAWLRQARLPLALKYLFIGLAMLTWRWIYYAPNSMRELVNHRQKRRILGRDDGIALAPWTPVGRAVWGQCLLPYMLVHFVVLPLPFLAFGTTAWMWAVINRVGADVLANVHSFVVIVPSHVGDDLWRFDTPIRNRDDFYRHQLAGSANYRTGGFWNDLLHGWLNYQIEHHLFPDLTMRQYTRAQPQVEAIAHRHGLPYVQNSVWVRLRRLLRVMVGTETMPMWPDETPQSGVPASPPHQSPPIPDPTQA